MCTVQRSALPSIPLGPFWIQLDALNGIEGVSGDRSLESGVGEDEVMLVGVEERGMRDSGYSVYGRREEHRDGAEKRESSSHGMELRHGLACVSRNWPRCSD